MTRPTQRATDRPFRTRWTVALFVVIALVVCTAIMLWQLSNDTPDEPDGVGVTPGAWRPSVDAAA